jgi:outer membrane lipoprotein-sorting protein
MNCAECRENLVACAEGLLDREQALQCQAHLETCAACRAEYTAITRLQQQLVARGPATAEVSLVKPVMQRVHTIQTERERNSIMTKLFTRWGFGLSAAAGAAAIILIAFLVFPKAQATAAEIMIKGAQAVAKLTSIHLRGQLRTYPADNFSFINADSPFYSIELWKQFEPDLKWRVEKPQRVVVMDGKSTVMLIKSGNTGVKLPQRTTSAFDTEWLHRIANLSNTISNELDNARAKGWKLNLTEETGTDGRLKSVVTVLAKSGVPDNDYCKNTFMENADTRRVYRFDAQSKLLESVQIYLTRPSGEVQIFDLSQIDYNQPIDSSVWKLELPADTSWAQLPEQLSKLPDNEKYASMTAQQAARAFFEACGREDWNEAGKYMSPINDRLKEYLGGVKIISLGEPFTSKDYPGQFVPYEIKLQAQELNLRVSNTNAAKRYVLAGIYDSKLRLQQNIEWPTEAEILTNNDVYARLSPKEVVQAYLDAQSKFKWVEMRKFTSESDVEETKGQVAMAEKQGLDMHKLMPVFEVGEAIWSPEQSAWFVKCHAFQTKKRNLAVRKDNPAGRWQVDGGL